MVELAEDFPPDQDVHPRFGRLIKSYYGCPPDQDAHWRFLKSVIEDQEVSKHHLSEFIRYLDGGSRLLKLAMEHELRHRCHRQVNKRLSLELALYHLNGSSADGFWRANWKLGELKQRHDTAKVGA